MGISTELALPGAAAVSPNSSINVYSVAPSTSWVACGMGVQSICAGPRGKPEIDVILNGAQNGLLSPLMTACKTGETGIQPLSTEQASAAAAINARGKMTPNDR